MHFEFCLICCGARVSCWHFCALPNQGYRNRVGSIDAGQAWAKSDPAVATRSRGGKGHQCGWARRRSRRFLITSSTHIPVTMSRMHPLGGTPLLATGDHAAAEDSHQQALAAHASRMPNSGSCGRPSTSVVSGAARANKKKRTRLDLRLVHGGIRHAWSSRTPVAARPVNVMQLIPYLAR